MGRFEGLRGRLDGIGARLAEIGQPAVLRLMSEVRRTVDFEIWRSAPTLPDRLKAVSWPRASIGAGAVAAVVGGLMFAFLYDRSDAYPPPDPTEREFAARGQALKSASRTPPSSLIEANKSWKAE